MKKLLVVLVAVLAMCGVARADGLLTGSLLREIVFDGLGIRRAVVGNDWVYVKSENKLYRRYIPSKGIGFLRIYRGNKALIAAGGKITRWNKGVVVYSDIKSAIIAQPKATISDESKGLVENDSKKCRAPEWWQNRRLQKEWQPGD